MLFVKPVAGRKVRDPASRLHIPAHGKAVADDPYWHRRLKSGDIELTTEAEIASGAATAASELARAEAPVAHREAHVPSTAKEETFRHNEPHAPKPAAVTPAKDKATR